MPTPFDPTKNPKVFLTILLGAGFRILTLSTSVRQWRIRDHRRSRETSQEASTVEQHKMPRARAEALLGQVSEAIARGGGGTDITDVPSEELFAHYRLMGQFGFGRVTSKEALDHAEESVTEVERRYGALGP